MNFRLRNLILLALMLVGAFSSYMLKPTKRLSDQIAIIDIEQAIPKSFGQWEVDANASPIPPSAESQEAVAKIYDQMLSRTYVNRAGERIMLSIAYGGAQNQQLRAHRQEVCYAAQGFQISRLHQVSLQFDKVNIKGTRMVAQLGNQRTEPVTYWFTMGDEVVSTYLDRQVAQLRYAFSGYIPDGYLFRVSSISTDVESAFDRQHLFAEELLKSSEESLVSRLLGTNR